MSRTAHLVAAAALAAGAASLAQPASAATVCRSVNIGIRHVAGACVTVDPNGPSVSWTCTIGDQLACA